MKKFMITAMVSGLLLCSNLYAVAAEKIGYVDMNRVLSSYKKAQTMSSDIKIQQAEIQKMIEEARKQVKEAKNDKEKKELEKKLTEKIQQKTNSAKAEYEKQIKELDTKVVSTIKKVAETKQVDTIFKKENLIVGGVDLTDEVIKELEK